MDYYNYPLNYRQRLLPLEAVAASHTLEEAAHGDADVVE